MHTTQYWEEWLRKKMRQPMNNIIKCDKCSLSLIQEETINHKCSFKITQFCFNTDDDFVEIFDGSRWIQIKSKVPYQPKGNTDKSTDKGTEPGRWHCQIVVG